MVELLRVKRVSVNLNGKRILKDVTYELKPGELSLIVGPNGSGKSTLFKTIMGLVIPNSGKITLNNVDITSRKPHEKFELGIVLAPEKMRVALNLTVEENLKIAGEDISCALKVFPELRMLLRRKCKSLSGGERQMVVLARALVSRAKYLLFDEPFQGLHPDVRYKIIEILQKLSKNIGVAIITHDEIEEVFPISNRTCIMVGGEVAYFGKSEDAEKVMKKFMFI